MVAAAFPAHGAEVVAAGMITGEMLKGDGGWTVQ